MSDELKTRAISHDEPLNDIVFSMVNAMKLACSPYVSQAGDPRDGMSAMMTAAAMLAGAQFGSLMVLGAVRQQDTKRAVDAAGRNFREGIKVGMSQAARFEQEANIGGRA